VSKFSLELINKMLLFFQAGTSEWDSNATASLDKTTYFSNNTSLEARPSINNIASTSSASAYASSDFTYTNPWTKSDTGNKNSLKGY